MTQRAAASSTALKSYKQASVKGHVAGLDGLVLLAEGTADLDEAERLYAEPPHRISLRRCSISVIC